MSAHADAAGGKQSRRMSLFEAITNVVVGYSLAVATQFAVFPLFGLEVTLAQNLLMGSLFTGISVVRSYALRRVLTPSAYANAYEAICIGAETRNTAECRGRPRSPWRRLQSGKPECGRVAAMSGRPCKNTASGTKLEYDTKTNSFQ